MQTLWQLRPRCATLRTPRTTSTLVQLVEGIWFRIEVTTLGEHTQPTAHPVRIGLNSSADLLQRFSLYKAHRNAGSYLSQELIYPRKTIF